jgi:hypothetical protein
VLEQLLVKKQKTKQNKQKQQKTTKIGINTAMRQARSKF